MRYFLISCLLITCIASEEPSALYLSWQRDPTSTMTVQWHTTMEDKGSVVSYRRLGAEEWLQRKGRVTRLHQSDILVHTVELTYLDEGADYCFRIGQCPEVYRFRTLAGGSPVRFVVGGDAFFDLGLFRELNAQIARLDPDFVVVGGDIAYTRGSRKGVLQGVEWEAKRWQLFFEEWQSAMVGADGRLIPLVAVLGNHDICSARGTKRRASYMFYDVFAFPQPLAAYRVLDVGEELSLILLDTGHMTPIAGEQAAWLEGVLAEREEVPYKMAVYHVGAYPAVYKYGGRTATRVRESWCPLFDRYHVRLAFEHHSHAYKRTHPIQSGKVDPEGVVYLGDGCWGVSPRTTVSLKEAWYLARAASKNHFFLVSVNQNACCVQAFGSEGQLLDAVEVAPYRPLSGDEAFEEAGGACCEGR